MFARQVMATGLPSRSVVTRLAVLRPIARSLIAAAPPQRSMSQLDCQPPRLECWVPGWAARRWSIALRNSTLRAAASGTSEMTLGVENSGTISRPLLIGVFLPTKWGGGPQGRRGHKTQEECDS